LLPIHKKQTLTEST